MKITYVVYNRNENMLIVGDKNKVVEYEGYSSDSTNSLVCGIKKKEIEQ